MPFQFTPELLQRGLTMLGVAAGQLKHLQPETKLAVGRFIVRAFASGDANAFIQRELGRIEHEEAEPEPPPRPARPVRVTATFVEDDSPPRKARR